MKKAILAALLFGSGLLTPAAYSRPASYLGASDPGALGGFLYQYDHTIGTNPALSLRVFVFSAQLKAASEQYGGIDKIPSNEMIQIQRRNDQLGQELAQEQKNTSGDYQFNKNIKDGI